MQPQFESSDAESKEKEGAPLVFLGGGQIDDNRIIKLEEKIEDLTKKLANVVGEVSRISKMQQESEDRCRQLEDDNRVLSDKFKEHFAEMEQSADVTKMINDELSKIKELHGKIDQMGKKRPTYPQQQQPDFNSMMQNYMMMQNALSSSMRQQQQYQSPNSPFARGFSPNSPPKQHGWYGNRQEEYRMPQRTQERRYQGPTNHMTQSMHRPTPGYPTQDGLMSQTMPPSKGSFHDGNRKQHEYGTRSMSTTSGHRESIDQGFPQTQGSFDGNRKQNEYGSRSMSTTSEHSSSSGKNEQMPSPPSSVHSHGDGSPTKSRSAPPKQIVSPDGKINPEESPMFHQEGSEKSFGQLQPQQRRVNEDTSKEQPNQWEQSSNRTSSSTLGETPQNQQNDWNGNWDQWEKEKNGHWAGGGSSWGKNSSYQDWGKGGNQNQ